MKITNSEWRCFNKVWLRFSPLSDAEATLTFTAGVSERHNRKQRQNCQNGNKNILVLKTFRTYYVP